MMTCCRCSGSCSRSCTGSKGLARWRVGTVPLVLLVLMLLCLGRDGVCAQFHIMHLQRLCSRDSNTIHIVIIIITSIIIIIINSDLCVARGCHGATFHSNGAVCEGSACQATGGSVASLNYAVGECVPVRLPLAVQCLVRAVSCAHHHQQRVTRVWCLGRCALFKPSCHPHPPPCAPPR